MKSNANDILQRNIKLFKEYIQKKRIVIVDYQPAARAALAKIFTELGAPMTSISLCGSYDEAEQIINVTKPHVVIADYELGKRCGLDLLQAQRKNNTDTKQMLFILVTGNTSQAAVAQAAEEDIDGYILKPYTVETLRASLMRFAISKVFPTNYMKTIDAGKEQMLAGKFDEAMKYFEDAQAMDKKPSLAFFYHGQVEFMKKVMSNAENDYNSGLSFNKIHYKCMTGLFDLFMAQKKSKEAYDVVRKIARYFPANPERLASVLRLAVMNKAYEDIERYYQLFCKLDQRNEELIRYVCAALIVCGKYYLQSKQGTRAVELFNKASATGLGRPVIIKEIVLSLMKYNMSSDATKFLQKYPIELQSMADYQVLRYVAYEKAWDIGVSITQGRELVQKGIKDYMLFATLIERSFQAGYREHAEQLLQEAEKLWPEHKAELAQLDRQIDKEKKEAA